MKTLLKIFILLLVSMGGYAQIQTYENGEGMGTVRSKINSNFLYLDAKATASGTDTYTADISPVITSYVQNQEYNIKFTNANTGAATLNLNSIGAKSIRKNGTEALEADDIKAGSIKTLVYDGTYLQCLNCGGSGASDWGDLGGTLSDQTDLQAALDAKEDLLTFTASDFNESGQTISIDYTNGQSASSGQKGFLTAADWTSFDGKASTAYVDAKVTQTITNGVTTTAPSEDVVYDNLGTVTIVSITGATVLTSTAYTPGKIHLVTGTSADYTITLPTAVGITGKSIYFKGSSALTKIITLDGNASETLDGAANLTFSAYSMIGITSDGSNWFVQGNASQTISSLPFAVGSGGVALTNQGSAEQYFGNTGFSRYYFDATAYNTVRVTCNISVSSASANSPRLFPQYSTDGGSNWITIGAGTVASGDAVSLASTGLFSTNWIQIPTGARGNYQFRVAQQGGDGVADPNVGSLLIQFRQ